MGRMYKSISRNISTFYSLSQDFLLDRFIDVYAQREAERTANASNPTNSKFVRLIQKRIARKMDARIAITGDSGVGKSTLELRLGELLNPELYVNDIDKAINDATSFTAKQYLHGVRTLPSESQLSFDEPAQAWFHRQFMSEVNMILSKTIIGFRFKRFKSVFTLPDIDLLDADGLRLFHYLIFIPTQGRAEVYRIMKQKFGGDPWFKKIVDNLRFSKPDAKLWHIYEEKKFKMQDELYEVYGKRLEELETPQLSNTDIILAIQAEPKKYYDKKGKLKIPAIQRDFKIGMNKGYLIKAMLEGDSEEQVPEMNYQAEPAEALLKKITEDQL